MMSSAVYGIEICTLAQARRKRTNSAVISCCRLCNCVTDPGWKSLSRDEWNDFTERRGCLWQRAASRQQGFAFGLCAVCMKTKLGYLQGRDCCDHYKPTKLHRRMTRIWLVSCNNFTGGILIIRHRVSLAYLLNAHSNPEHARKFRERQHRLDLS